MSSVLFWLWVIHTATTQAYFLSLDSVPFSNASRYCQTFCNSHLAHIQSEAQYQRIASQTENTAYIYDIDDIWIGSNLSSKYVASGEPMPSTNGDVHYVVTTDSAPYQWRSKMPSDRHHFFCHSCHGQINKYAGIFGVYNYSQASAACRATFKTSLASIANDDDMLSARMTCREIDDSHGCWIGLRNFEWSDNTPFLYGAAFNRYPWFASESAMDTDTCTVIKPSNDGDAGEYLWDNEFCGADASVLCNAPSEVCDDRHWFAINGEDAAAGDWTFDSIDGMCGVRTNAWHKEHTLVLGGKQFYNADKMLTIEMAYRIHEVGVSGSAGLVLFMNETRCDSFYYIGYWPLYSVLFMGRFVDGEWFFMDWRNTPNSYRLGDDLPLKVTLGVEQNQQIWKVYLNHSLVMELNITQDEFGHLHSPWSGHVGIRSVNTSMSVASLFVSGDADFLGASQQKLYQSCTNVSYSTLPPTMMPIAVSTATPTDPPTVIATAEPTKTPIINEIQVFESPAPTPQPTGAYDEETTNEFVISAQYWHLAWIIGAPLFLLLCCGAVLCAVHYYCCSGGEEYEYEPGRFGECDAYGPNSVDYL